TTFGVERGMIWKNGLLILTWFQIYDLFVIFNNKPFDVISIPIGLDHNWMYRNTILGLIPMFIILFFTCIQGAILLDENYNTKLLGYSIINYDVARIIVPSPTNIMAVLEVQGTILIFYYGSPRNEGYIGTVAYNIRPPDRVRGLACNFITCCLRIHWGHTGQYYNVFILHRRQYHLLFW
ncbi:hypothetical protein ACJX0J_039568, partial [Zea mays]